MSSTGAVRLSGMDVFHVRLHQEMRSRGLAGNSCALVLQLNGRLDAGALAARLEAAAALLPELGWRLGHDLRLQPVWRRGRSPEPCSLTVRELGRDQAVLDETTAWLDEPQASRDSSGS